MSTVNTKENYKGAFALMTSLFFIWGAIVSLNDILIPHFKSLFEMNYTETMLIQFCFFGAYFIMAIPASMLIARIGYKKGISAGLVTIGMGALIFLPASWLLSYPLFLFGLFTMATGSVILQVVANPYILVLGPSKTASSRLNLAQGINSLATTLAPLAGGLLILGHYNTPQEAAAAVSRGEASGAAPGRTQAGLGHEASLARAGCREPTLEPRLRQRCADGWPPVSDTRRGR